MSPHDATAAGIGGDIFLSRTSHLDRWINLARANSLYWMLFGLACCGIEMMQTAGPRGDFERFGHPRAPPLVRPSS